MMKEKHIKFLSDNFGVTDFNSLDDDTFYDLYDKICDIEVSECQKEPVSERGNIAADIITYMCKMERFNND